MWNCAITGSGQCTAVGWGNINDSINLTSGSKATYTAICALSSTAVGSLANTASVMPPAGVNDSDMSNNSATDTDTVAVATNITMAVNDGGQFVRIGQVLTYTIEVTNGNGPSDAQVTVTDVLPSQLSNGSWQCTGSGSASCGSGSSGNTLSDTATVPVGGKVDYLFTATVANELPSGKIVNSAGAVLNFGTNQPSGSIGASHSDTVVIFRANFETPPSP
jgi:uncharacterized repeat protein (TIGR01451 family)